MTVIHQCDLKNYLEILCSRQDGSLFNSRISLEFNYLNRTIFTDEKEEYLRYPSFPRAVPKIPRRLFCLFCFFFFKFIYIYQIIEITIRKSSPINFSRMRSNVYSYCYRGKVKFSFQSFLSFSFFLFFSSIRASK